LLPKILSVLLLLFVSVFALDVFNSPQWPLALLMHLLPSFVLLVLTIIAWKRPRVGGILFILVGLVTQILLFKNSLIIALPMAIIGVLFLI
jgi:hypothetical protein